MSAYSCKKTVHFTVNADPSARYLINLLQWFIKHPMW